MSGTTTRQLRRDLLKLAALFSAGSALAPSLRLRAQNNANAPLRIGYLPITDATPLLVAHAQGFFADQGIEVEKPVLLRSWSQLLEAFISGQVNLVHLLAPMTIWARYGSQLPAKVVAWNHMSGSALTVAPHIQKISDLAGQTIAIPFHYSVHNVVLQYMLREAGLQPVLNSRQKLQANQVRLSVMAPSDMVPALASKSIAAFTVAEPFNAQAELLQVGKILRFTGDVWRDHACCVLFMQEHDLNQRPEWSQKVVNGIVQAQHWILSHRAETAQILAHDHAQKYTPHSVTALSKVLNPNPDDQQHYIQSGAIQHPEWQDKRINFQPYPFPSYTEELVRQLQQMQFEQGSGFLADLEPTQVADELVDNRFVKQAILDLGGPELFGLNAQWQRSEDLRL